MQNICFILQCRSTRSTQIQPWLTQDIQAFTSLLGPLFLEVLLVVLPENKHMHLTIITVGSWDTTKVFQD